MPGSNALLVIDVGTTTVKAVVVSGAWREGRVTRVPLTTRRPRPGWVEQDAVAIARAAERAGGQALLASGRPPSRIAGIALAFQRSTCLLIDPRNGKVLSPAVNWQCLRAVDDVEAMRQQGLERTVRAVTGLPLRAYWAGPKLAWLWQRAGSSVRRRAAAVTLDAYITHRLTGGRTLATDPSIASRTLLHDSRSIMSRRRASDATPPDRSATLRAIFGLQEAERPRVLPTVGERGRLSRRWQRALPAGIPVLVSIGDQQAALIGCRGWRLGRAALTFGTGVFVLARSGGTPPPATRGFLPTVLIDERGRPGWGLEGGGVSAAAAMRWLENLGPAHENRAAARGAPLTGPLCVPAMNGLGPPWCDSEVRTLIANITSLDSTGTLRDALLEGICWMARDLLEGLEEILGRRLAPTLTGGLLHAGTFTSLAAAVLRRPLSRAPWIEATALGAALLAARAAGLRPAERLERPLRVAPLTLDPEIHARRACQWRAALAAARSIAHPTHPGRR